MSLNDSALERKWKNSGMTGCRSAPEFLLKIDVLGIKIEDDDLEYLINYAAHNLEFCDVMRGVIADTAIFDEQLRKLIFYIDYYMAMTRENQPDPMKFGRIKIFDKCELSSYRHFIHKSESLPFISMMNACADKVDILFEGRLEHVKHFKSWLEITRLCGK